MAAAVRSFSSTSYGSRTNTTITAPAGIQDGDVLVLVHELFFSGSPPSSTLPAGFAELAGFPSDINPASSDRLVLRVAYKVASGEAGDYTVTHATATTQGAIVCVSGPDASDTPAATVNTGTTSTVTATGLTPAEDGSVVIFVGCHYDGITTTTPPAGSTPTFTEYLDGVIMYVAAGVMSPAGATGDKTIIADGAGMWHATLVAVEPPPASAPSIRTPDWSLFPKPKLRYSRQ